MKSEPLLSIVIPVFNSSDFLSETVSPLLDYTNDFVEILLVDDGSTDASPGLIDYFREQDERVVTVRQDNRGSGAARNLGIGLATGRFLLFLDSDDLINPARLVDEVLIPAAHENLELALFDTEPFTNDPGMEVALEGYVKHYRRSAKLSQKTLSGNHLATELISHASYTPSACLYLAQREFLLSKDIRFPEHQLMEDNPFTFEVLSLSRAAKYFPFTVHRRRLISQSRSQTLDPLPVFSGYLDSLIRMKSFCFNFDRNPEWWQERAVSSIERRLLDHVDSIRLEQIRDIFSTARVKWSFS